MEFEVSKIEDIYRQPSIEKVLEGTYSNGTAVLSDTSVKGYLMDIVMNTKVYKITPNELDSMDFRMKIIKDNIRDIDQNVIDSWCADFRFSHGYVTLDSNTPLTPEEINNDPLLCATNDLLEIVANSNIEYIHSLPLPICAIRKDIYEKLVCKFESFDIDSYVERAMNEQSFGKNSGVTVSYYTDYINNQDIALEFINKTLSHYKDYETPFLNDTQNDTWAFLGNYAIYTAINLIYKFRLQIDEQQAKKLYGIVREPSNLNLSHEVHYYIIDQTDRYTNKFINTLEFANSLRNSSTGPVQMLFRNFLSCEDFSIYNQLYNNCKPNTRAGIRSFLNMYQIKDLLKLEVDPPTFLLPQWKESEFKEIFSNKEKHRIMLVNNFKICLELWDNETIEKNKYYIQEFLKRVCVDDSLSHIESTYTNIIPINNTNKEDILFKYLVNCMEESNKATKFFKALISKLIKGYDYGDYELKRVYTRYNPDVKKQDMLTNLEVLKNLVLENIETENKKTIKVVNKVFKNTREELECGIKD